MDDTDDVATGSARPRLTHGGHHGQAFPRPFARYTHTTSRPVDFSGDPAYMLFISFPRAVEAYAAKAFLHRQIPPGIRFAFGTSNTDEQPFPIRGGLLFGSDADRGRAGKALRAQKALLSTAGLELEYPLRDMNPPHRDGCFRCGQPGHRREECPAAFVPNRCAVCNGNHNLRACRERPDIDTLLERSASTAPVVVPVTQSVVRVHERDGDRERVTVEQVLRVGPQAHPPVSAVVATPASAAPPGDFALLLQQMQTMTGLMHTLVHRLLPRLEDGPSPAAPLALASSVPGLALQAAQDVTTPIPPADE